MSSEERDDDAAAPAGGDGGGSEEGAAAAGSGKRVLTARKLEKLQARAEKKGVVYLSRVPPFMKPVKLRHLLSQHGEVLRIYLAAEGAPPAQPGGANSAAPRKGEQALTPALSRAQMRRRACGASAPAATAARSSRKGACAGGVRRGKATRRPVTRVAQLGGVRGQEGCEARSSCAERGANRCAARRREALGAAARRSARSPR